MNYLKFFLLLFLLFDCLRSHVEASVQLNKFGIEFILDIQYWILKEPISKFLTSRSLVVRLRGKVKLVQPARSSFWRAQKSQPVSYSGFIYFLVL